MEREEGEVTVDLRNAKAVKDAVADLFQTNANSVGVEVDLPVNSRVGEVTITVAVAT